MEPTMIGPSVAGFGILAIIIMAMLISAVASILTVLPFWKICSRAGFPGALSLLMLVPVANVVLPFYIAFAKWPALPERY